LARVAERARFELAIGSLRCRFSRPVHSTALPPLLVIYQWLTVFIYNHKLSTEKNIT
jgi:hypothetical protein